ncbi:hypothetical protein [Nannocystis pusilla]|uniref:Uncharacterized protein n=1 Tax=Nannocystis pusilla TaxID=889268 RepID=A0ABS7TSU3_9BACT|nr:hypothetical protein [Nannocystis pusilla]MBZ5711309.1 hypothetical protein [Nannocystis pusilla]
MGESALASWLERLLEATGPLGEFIVGDRIVEEAADEVLAIGATKK